MEAFCPVCRRFDWAIRRGNEYTMVCCPGVVVARLIRMPDVGQATPRMKVSR